VVTLRVLFWQVSVSQVILLLMTLVLGFVLGFLAAKLPKGGSQPKAERPPSEKI
jgi:hypothetical protein